MLKENTILLLKKQEILILKRALDFISSSMEEGSRINVLSIDISSYASPEGEVDLNTNLAEDRGKSAMSFLMSKA